MLRFCFVLVVVFVQNSATQLCSDTNPTNPCICRRITSKYRDLVLTEAICIDINLNEFPKSDDLPPDTLFLDISFNKIENFTTNAGIYYTSDTLEVLNMSYNRLRRFDNIKLKNLRDLDLSNNFLDGFDQKDAFAGFPELRRLDLSNNNMVAFTGSLFLPLVYLESLNVGYNTIAFGKDFISLFPTLGINPKLRQLEMENLNISNFPPHFFDNFTGIERLSLADNFFDVIPQVPHSLEYLDLSGSGIREVHARFFNYQRLETLKLNRLYKLKEVPKYAFYNLQSLEELSITDCPQLKAFSELAFGVIRRDTSLSVKKLNLARNAITHLNYTYSYVFGNFDFVDISSNPWRCDCDILWMQDITNFHRPEKIQCESPLILFGKEVDDLVDSDLRPCFPEKYGKKGHRILIIFLIMLIMLLASLIGYLIYYAPQLRGNTVVGPDSPYALTRNSDF